MRRLVASSTTWNCRVHSLPAATCSSYLALVLHRQGECHTKHPAALEGPQSTINRSHACFKTFNLRCMCLVAYVRMSTRQDARFQAAPILCELEKEL